MREPDSSQKKLIDTIERQSGQIIEYEKLFSELKGQCDDIIKRKDGEKILGIKNVGLIIQRLNELKYKVY